MKLRTRLADNTYSTLAVEEVPFIDIRGNFIHIRLMAGKYQSKPYELILSKEELAALNSKVERTIASPPNAASANASSATQRKHPAMTDIIWKLDDTVNHERYLYKPVSPAGHERFSSCIATNGWYSFGDWSPRHPALTKAHRGLVVTPASEYVP